MLESVNDWIADFEAIFLEMLYDEGIIDAVQYAVDPRVCERA